MTDAFDALFGAVRGCERPVAWWRAPAVPESEMAAFLDLALMAGHTSVSLTLYADGSWEADGAGGRAPTAASGEESTGADWLLTWAPQTHAVLDEAPGCWTWRLDGPAAESTRRP